MIYMEREELIKYTNIMIDLEGQWFRDRQGLYQFYKPEEMSPEAIEAADKLNENYIAAKREWDRYIEMYGNEPIVISREELDDD